VEWEVAWAEVECMVAVQEVLTPVAPAAIAAVWPRARIAQLAALVVATVAAPEPCHTLVAVRASTFKRPPTSMLGVVETSMLFALEEISHASSRPAAC